MTFDLIHCWVIAVIIAVIEIWRKDGRRDDQAVILLVIGFKTFIYYLGLWFVDGVFRYWIFG